MAFNPELAQLVFKKTKNNVFFGEALAQEMRQTQKSFIESL